MLELIDTADVLLDMAGLGDAAVAQPCGSGDRS